MDVYNPLYNIIHSDAGCVVHGSFQLDISVQPGLVFLPCWPTNCKVLGLCVCVCKVAATKFFNSKQPIIKYPLDAVLAPVTA